MEFSSSPSLDLVALVDPAVRGTAPQLASSRCGDAAAGVGLAFDLCLGQLLPALPAGETLPPGGKDLPVVAAEDAATDTELTAETLAFALPGWVAMPAPGTAPSPLSSALDASASGAALPSGAGASPALDAAAQSREARLAPSAAAGAAATAAASAAQPGAIVGASTDTSSATSGAQAAPDDALAPSQPNPSKDGAAPSPAAPIDAASVADDYAAAVANAGVRGDATSATRRGDDLLRGARMSWRDARHANGLPSSTTDSVAASNPSPSNAPSAAAAAAVTPPVPPVRGELMTQGRGPSADGAAPVAEVATPSPGHGAWLAPGTPAAHANTSAGAAASHASAEHTPVDTTQPRWQEAFASRVQWLAEQNVGEANLRLNPPDLGTVDVKISLVEDRTFVHLTTHTAAARDELAQSLPRLRELFASSGLELGGASVQNGRDGQARYDGSAPERGYAGREPTVPGSDESASGRTSARRSASAVGRIDLFA